MSRKRQPRICERCLEAFQPKGTYQRFCSYGCSNSAVPKGNNKRKYVQPYKVRFAEEIRTKRRNKYHSDPLFKKRDFARLAAQQAHPNPKPCEFCGATENIHRHHDDYDKPLEIRWLCASCHKRFHLEQMKGAA